MNIFNVHTQGPTMQQRAYRDAYSSPLHITDTNKLFSLHTPAGSQLQLLAALSGQNSTQMPRHNQIQLTTQSMSMPQIVNRQAHMPVVFVPGIGPITNGSQSTDRILNLSNGGQIRQTRAVDNSSSTLASVYSLLQNLPQTHIQTIHNAQQSVYPGLAASAAAQLYTAALESQQIEELNKVLKAAQVSSQQQQLAQAHKEDILRLLAHTGQKLHSPHDHSVDAASKQAAGQQQI